VKNEHVSWVPVQPPLAFHVQPWQYCGYVELPQYVWGQLEQLEYDGVPVQAAPETQSGQ
jgi:hypothetical protein